MSAVLHLDLPCVFVCAVAALGIFGAVDVAGIQAVGI